MKPQTIRAKALAWWKDKYFADKFDLSVKYKTILDLEEFRHPDFLSDEEIEKIWWAEMEANSEQFHKENPAEKETTVKNQQTLKNEMINAFIEYSTRIYPEDGYSYKAVDESDFKDLVDELFRRFKIG